MRWTVGAKIGAGFGTALLILVGIGGIAYRSTNQLMETADWVTHTHRVMESLDGILQAMIDAETGQRGYIITGDDRYLEPYRSGVAHATQYVANVRTLTSDNPVQQRRLENLEPMIANRVRTLQEGIDIRTNKNFESTRDWISAGKGKNEMDELRKAVMTMRDNETALLKERSAEAQAAADNTNRSIIGGTIGAFILLLASGAFITRNISIRLREMTSAAKRIAEGDLSEVRMNLRSQDEVGQLASTLENMRSSLRDMASQVRQATDNVNSTAAEILASTQQQATATKEQAATIQEVTSTMEEINQSGNQIGDRAREVTVTVETGSNATQRGIRATQETSQTMEAIRDQVEKVAENIVNLSERTQTIGEIIATVSEIAEQSNLLALNASIEAVSAGEHGGRFSVVAHEMKNLADRAKECTVQVRTILGEIQKGINTSVMLTEEAVKRADGGKQQAHATEGTIREVTSANEQSIQAFQQIVAGSGQQQIGVRQVTQAMQDIRQAVTQVASGTSQLEKAASNMTALSQQLHRIVAQYRI